MPKIKRLILSKVDRELAIANINALADEVIANRTPLLQGSIIQVITIEEALKDLHADGIRNSDVERLANGQPYTNLTTWDLLEVGEFLCVYDIETNAARLLTDRETDQYILSPGLTASDIRRWYANRKSDDEYLVSDFDALNFWIPEDV